MEFSQANQENQGEAGDGVGKDAGRAGRGWSGIRKTAQQFLLAEVPSARVWPETRVSHSPRARENFSSPRNYGLP